jgi:hypothetical protein
MADKCISCHAFLSFDASRLCAGCLIVPDVQSSSSSSKRPRSAFVPEDGKKQRRVAESQSANKAARAISLWNRIVPVTDHSKQKAVSARDRPHSLDKIKKGKFKYVYHKKHRRYVFLLAVAALSDKDIQYIMDHPVFDPRDLRSIELATRLRRWSDARYPMIEVSGLNISQEHITLMWTH